MEDTLPPGLVYIHAYVVAVRIEFVVRSKKFSQCRNGIIREWPGLTG